MFENYFGIKFPDIYFTGEERPRKNLAEETCLNRGSNLSPLHEERESYLETIAVNLLKSTQHYYEFSIYLLQFGN